MRLRDRAALIGFAILISAVMGGTVYCAGVQVWTPAPLVREAGEFRHVNAEFGSVLIAEDIPIVRPSADIFMGVLRLDNLLHVFLGDKAPLQGAFASSGADTRWPRNVQVLKESSHATAATYSGVHANTGGIASVAYLHSADPAKLSFWPVIWRPSSFGYRDECTLDRDKGLLSRAGLLASIVGIGAGDENQDDRARNLYIPRPVRWVILAFCYMMAAVMSTVAFAIFVSFDRWKRG